MELEGVGTKYSWPVSAYYPSILQELMKTVETGWVVSHLRFEPDTCWVQVRIITTISEFKCQISYVIITDIQNHVPTFSGNDHSVFGLYCWHYIFLLISHGGALLVRQH